MEIWLFLHNTTSHQPGPVVPQISLTHRPKDGRIITILVELAFLQAMSYHLSSKTSPPISLLSHSNLVPHFLISRTLLSRHNHCAPPTPTFALRLQEECVDDIGNTQRHSSENSSSI